jgi:hypothetical protein
MPRDKIMVECDLCNRRFEHGVEGRSVGAWNLCVCRSCGGSPYGEVTPSMNGKLRDLLESKGISFRLSDQGWIKWP